MRLARKLTVALFFGIVAVLTVHAYRSVNAQVDQFETDMRLDQHLIGHALSEVIGDVWTTDGLQHARELVAYANERESRTRIRWVWLRHPEAGRVPGLSPAEADQVAQGREVSVTDRRERGVGRLYTYVPLWPKDPRGPALELSEALDLERSYVHATIVRATVTTLTAAAVCALIVMAIGGFFVGRPIHRLIDQARRVGAGDLSARLALRQQDEIGELGAEMNAMCDRLAEAHGRLASETAARIAALEQLRHADRLATVGKLASGIAHELGTPLNVVSGRAKMIAGGEVAGDELVDNARVIVEQSQRMTAIIRQLLDFARRRGRVGQTPPAPIDLGELARQTVAMLVPLADKRGVSLRVADGESRPGAPADGGLIQQALTNLIVNGVHATPRGGTVTVGVGRARVRPPADHGGPEAVYARIDVRDEGAGISADVVPHVFEPFFTTKDVGEGTGLGLSVAYGIVREHDGWIALDTGEGRGSCFSIYLPAACPAEAQA